MKDFYGQVIPMASLNHVAHHLVSEKLKPIGLDPSWDSSAVLHIVAGRLHMAKQEDRRDALFLSIFDCHSDEMTIDEWCMFFCGYVTGEGLGLATCFALVNDKTAPTRLPILVCCVDGDGKRTPFNTLDRLKWDLGMAPRSPSGAN